MNETIVRLLEQPRVYLAWQRPFVSTKLAPLWRHTERSTVRRVLDVGCGPGTNASEFAGVDYVGVDINPSYIDYARRRHGLRFEVADVQTDPIDGRGAYDLVLLNSLLHHLADEPARALLAGLVDFVSEDGHLHVIELELPAERGLPRTLAQSDRGEFPRSLDAWQELFAERYHEVVFEPFPVPSRGPTLWRMVYFKGRPRSSP